MTRKRKKDDDDLSIFVIIFFALLVLLVIATPFVLVGGYFYYKIKIKNKYSELNGNKSDFWLSQIDKNKFQQLDETLNNAYIEIENAHLKGSHEGVTKNQDGRFSVRSKLGKELREIIERNENIIEQNIEEYNDLKTLPKTRWEEFSNAIIFTKAFVFGFYSWFVGGLILISIYSNSFVSGITTFIKLPSLALDGALTGADWKILLGTTGISIIIFFIKYFIDQDIPQQLTPEPPEVTIDNYNQY